MRLAPALRTAALAAVFFVPALPALAADWAVDHEASVLGFEGSAFGAPVTGKFEEWSGEIAFDPDDLAAAEADITIDTTSIDTGDGTRDATLLGSNWFATERFPTAAFKATDFSQRDDGSFEAAGELSIRDVTQPVTLPFTFEATGDGTAHVTGALEVDRTTFGIGQGEFLEGGGVGKTVTITLDINARKAAEAP